MDDFTTAVRNALGDRAASRVAREAGLPPDTILRVLRGRDPLLSNARAVAAAVGLGFHIGSQPEEEPPPWKELLAEQEDLRRTVARALIRWAPGDGSPEVRHIRLRDIDLAAGAGAVVENEEVVGHLAFSADWLKQRGIDASQASIVRVTGRSMEPTLLEGSSVLVDETRRRRRAGEIFAIRSLDGGVVKRLEKDDRGRWLLVSDNPRYDPVAWGPDDELVGQVRWTARVL